MLRVPPKVGILVGVVGVALALAATHADARAASYPFPRSEVRVITTLCGREALRVGASVKSINYSRYRVVCAFRVNGGGTAMVKVTRPTYCSLRFQLWINGRLDGQVRIPAFC